jgi:hypothetical protein
VLFTDRELVEYEGVGVCYLIDEGPVFERRDEWVFLRLVVFRHKGRESIFGSCGLFRQQVKKLNIENYPVVLYIFLSKLNRFD